MPLATSGDIQAYLPDDKILVANIDNLNELQTDAERIIKGYLSGTFSPVTLAGWSDPSVPSSSGAYVPVFIRSIAGRFIAALAYRRMYSEDSLEDPQYAQFLYNEAMSYLNQVKDGTITLTDVTEEVDTGGHLTSADFYPNDSAGEPKFSMDMQF